MDPVNAQASPSGKKKTKTVVAVPFWLREFALVRLATVALAGSLGIVAAAVFASNWYLNDALDSQAQAKQGRDAAYARYAQVDNEKREISAYQPQFITLRSKGLIGEENRLDWVDAIRQIQERRRLLPLSYDIAPQQSVTLAAEVVTGEYLLRASRMNLRMDLLHELDLFNFLDDLRRRGYFGVQSCSLKRMAAAPAQERAPTVAAECTLNWLTLTPNEAMMKAQKKRGRR